jgi:heavy metal sensor kinase
VLKENPLVDAPYRRLREQGLSMRILDQSGKTVQAYGPYQGLPLPDFTATAPPQDKFSSITDLTSQDPLRLYSASIVHSEQVVGIVQVAQNLNQVHDTLNLLLVSLLVGGPLVVGAAGLGGYFLAARALAPIDQVTQTARHISANDLSARLNLPVTNDEVGRLVATFDSMLARLDEAFRRERQFTADASHELRTPLSAMQTIIDSILARRRTPAEYEQALLDLGQEAARMRTLTQGLLHLARQDAHKQATKFEQVDLAILLHDLVASFQPVAEEKGIQLKSTVPEEGLILKGDSDGLIRLFANLLDNAIKYTPQGSITVAAKVQGEQGLVVTVNDMGAGIPPEHIPHIFDRFYRVDGSRSTNGIGLGLAIARNIARAHGGEISVASVLGRGTSFTVELPTT